MRFQIEFSGHENIRSNHQKTLEITKDSHLTPRGDCIVGINANYGCSDLPDELKEKLRQPESLIHFSIIVDEQKFQFTAHGDPQLILSHNDDIVIRKSRFICPRTLAIMSDTSSDLIPREIVKKLQNPKTRGIFEIFVD